MTLTPIETIAFIIVVAGLIKAAVILINRKSLYNVIKVILAKPIITIIVALLLAVIVLNYLLIAGINIVQIFAAMAFGYLLVLSGYAIYSKDVLQLAKKILSRKASTAEWSAWIVWISLTIWVLYTLFA